MNRKTYIYLYVSTLCALALAAGCGTSARKLKELNRTQESLTLKLPGNDVKEMSDVMSMSALRDIVVVQDEQGNDLILMKAVLDSASGEMVANETLDAAVITAKFSNVAERHGKVAIEFDITVPGRMRDPKWQLRFNPVMYIMQDSLVMDSVIITGREFRARQMKGYERYRAFLNKIVSDPDKLVDVNQLEIFLMRNLPQIYALKFDESEVSEEQFLSYYGVSEQMAVEHYTNKFWRWHNERVESRKGAMYHKYIKAPLITDGIRLDTLLAGDGDFVYTYVQEIATRPKLRKVQVVVGGSIYEQGMKLYTIPRADTLTYYISSVSTLVENSEKYMTKVIQRKATVATSYNVEFAVSSAEVNLSLSDNREEISRMKDNVGDLLRNTVFDIDSVIVTASASPDGKYRANEALTLRRSASISDYMRDYIRRQQDSISKAAGYLIDLDGNVTEMAERRDVNFISRSIPEDWDKLTFFIENDDTFTVAQKEAYRSLLSISDPDRREAVLVSNDFYKYVKERYYPRLRSVRFDFHLARRGMVSDTVTTTEIDTVYMNGVQAIRDRDYDRAVILLSPYQDYNTAIAYVALDRNRSALEILERLDRDGEVNYLLAVVYSRMGNVRDAVQCYLTACRQDSRFVSRGNLDPEISVLIRQYGLNRDDGDDLLLQ